MRTHKRTTRLDAYRSSVFVILCLLAWATSFGQGQRAEKLDPYTQIEVAGHIELILEQGKEHSLELSSDDPDEVARYEVKQQGGLLRVIRRDEARDGEQEEVRLRLSSKSFSRMTVSGIVDLEAEGGIRGSELHFVGEGIINGDLDVDVSELSIQLSGICNMDVSGKADSASLKIDGMGQIDARKLEAKDRHQEAEGFSTVKF